MVKKYEQEVTCAEALLDHRGEPGKPTAPEGDGWRLVAALRGQTSSGGFPIWYWEREVEETRVLVPGEKP